MYCTNCGARVGDVNFCQRCGAPVKRDSEQSTWRERQEPEATSRDTRRERHDPEETLRNAWRDPERWETRQSESRASRRDPEPRDNRRDAEPRGFGAARRRAEEYLRDPKRTQELLVTALNKAGSRRGDQKLGDEIWEYLQLITRLVQASIRGEYTGLSGKNLTLIIAALLYYVSPIDIIPDIFPVAGLLDDVTILAFALRSLKGEVEAFKQWEIDRGREPRSN